ncbi:MAG: DAK2 domain-containing protein [Chloroflexota bacterium]
MKQVKSCSGQDLREMFSASVAWLEKNAADIDALNVFPVPDGDTGTNMLLTMRSTIEEAYRAPDHSACAVAQAMAKGALMGARGNSGVILSQIWRGLAQGLADKESFDASDLAAALVTASETAYKGLSNPVEGTILTVIREAAQAARMQASGDNGDIISVLEFTVNAAAESVANTPTLLPVLREAGVVDAGGQGLYTILEGAVRYLRGETEDMQYHRPQMVVSNIPLTGRLPQMLAADEESFGYCTEFMIKGEALDSAKLRTRLEKKGESLIVVGDEATIRVHIHTLDPGKVIHYATSVGTVHQVSIRNMDEQHKDFLEMQRDKAPAVDTAIIAVVSGEGLKDVFTSLGASVVTGGQTMNPSTKDLLQPVELSAADKVIILPNNSNIVATAEQVQELTEKSVAVVPTKTIPQGVAALLAFDYEADFETNANIMGTAKDEVRSIEITRAVRPVKLGELNIKKKQAIGFLDGDLVSVADSTMEALDKVLERLVLDEFEVVTIYYGADTTAEEAEQVRISLLEKSSHLQVEVIHGGQPHYNYIVSLE